MYTGSKPRRAAGIISFAADKQKRLHVACRAGEIQTYW